MLYQLHWQNREDLSRTEFVAQGEFERWNDLQNWLEDLINRRGHEMPDGWCPLVVEEGSKYFVLGAQIPRIGG